jgi:cyclase
LEYLHYIYIFLSDKRKRFMKTNRRQFIQHLAITPGIILTPWQKLLANILSQDAPYKMELLRSNIGIFTERGGTIGYLLSTDGIVVVDSQFPEQARNLIDEIKKRSDREIDLLINTHHHGDHTAGNIAFKGLIRNSVAHENSKRNQAQMAKQRDTEAQQLYPEMVYSDRWTKRVGNEVVTLKYFGPAHTNGDSVVHFEHANIAHLGDLIFNRRHPFVDRNAGASIRNWISVLGKIKHEYDNETMFIFGHAGEGFQVTGDKRDISAMQDYLQKVLDAVSNRIKRSHKREAILKMGEIPGAPEWKGDGILRTLTAAYEELTEN